MAKRRRADPHTCLTWFVLSGGADPRYDVVQAATDFKPSAAGGGGGPWYQKLRSRFWSQVLTGGAWRWRAEPVWSTALGVLAPMSGSPWLAATGLFWALAVNSLRMGATQAALHAAPAVCVSAACGPTAGACKWVAGPVAAEFLGSTARRYAAARRRRDFEAAADDLVGGAALCSLLVATHLAAGSTCAFVNE